MGVTHWTCPLGGEGDLSHLGPHVKQDCQEVRWALGEEGAPK